MSVVAVFLWFAAAAVLVPSLVFLVECLCARRAGDPPLTTGARPRLALLVPAHDEEEHIAATVTALRAELHAEDRLLVVADNCHDGTAAAAASAGAEVIERHEPERHGKGYALAFGVAHLAQQPPAVVVIVDADCRISADGPAQLGRLALRTGRPVQAEYLLTPPHKPDARSGLGVLAFVVRNLVRPRGLQRLGLPCQLTGSGMAFPWPLLRDAPPLRANLVEDMVLGIALALAGSPPMLCSAVNVASALPGPRSAQLRQRRRWEHGHLATLWSYGPRLLLAGLRRRRIALAAMALDLMVPPLALLASAIAGLTLVAAVATRAGATAGPLLLGLAAGALVLIAVARAWWHFGRHLVPARTFAAVPLYMLWKIPLYLGFFLRGRQARWERTSRATHVEGEPPP